MSTKDFTIMLKVDESPKVAFDAVNNVRGWWSEDTKGHTDKLNSEFEHRFEDIHRCKMKIVEFVPEKRVVWLVLSCHFKPGTFDKATKSKTSAKQVEYDDEWKDTKIIFDIVKKGSKAEIHFTHEGLTPNLECYEFCAKGWQQGVGKSLLHLITKGKGEPDPKQQ